MAITVEHKTRRTRPRAAGAAPHETRIAELRHDGKVIDTVVYSDALLRRLARQGTTAEEYASWRAGTCEI
jgi:hypothetical protein